MSNLTKPHTFKVGKDCYKIVTAEGKHRFTLLKNGALVDNIYGETSTCFEPPQLRFAPEDPLWEYTPRDRIAMEDAIAYLEIKYNTLQ